MSLDYSDRSELKLCSVTGFNVRELMFSLLVATEWTFYLERLSGGTRWVHTQDCEGLAAPVGPFESCCLRGLWVQWECHLPALLLPFPDSPEHPLSGRLSCGPCVSGTWQAFPAVPHVQLQLGCFSNAVKVSSRISQTFRKRKPFWCLKMFCSCYWKLQSNWNCEQSIV